jgi:hypothetical protein
VIVAPSETPSMSITPVLHNKLTCLTDGRPLLLCTRMIDQPSSTGLLRAQCNHKIAFEQCCGGIIHLCRDDVQPLFFFLPAKSYKLSVDKRPTKHKI